MYQFPAASELSSLIGEMLIQVCLDPHSTQFRLDSGHITAEYTVEQIDPEGKVWRYDCVAHEGPPIMLHRLVGKTIATVEVEPLRMKIGFADGAQLHFLSEIGPYECGQISIGGKFVVF